MNEAIKSVPANLMGPMISKEVRNQAIEFYNQATLAAQSNPSIAYSMLGSAIETDPTFFEAWFKMGCTNAEMNLILSAIGCFRRALECNPSSAETLVNLGWRLYHIGRNRDARKALERAAELDPSLPYIWVNLSLVESVDGNMKKAIAYARKSFAMLKEPIVETNLGLTLMMAGHYAEGLKHFEARFAYKLPQFHQYPMPQWQGDDLKGKTLFIQAEQGLGDTISFVRFIPQIAMKAGHLIMIVQGELLRLFHDMLLPWDNITLIPLPSPLPMADFWTTMHSLPVGLGLTDDEIERTPNLPVPNYRVPAPWKAPGRKLHVGIAWAGSPLQDNDRFRSMQVEQFLELCRVPDIHLYSLQVGERSNELHTRGCASLIKDVSFYIRDVTDTLAILNELDMVVTIESALLHIAGCIGKEAWIMVAKNAGDFRLGRAGNKSLWNPAHRVFRQQEGGDWDSVLNEVVEALKKRVTV